MHSNQKKIAMFDLFKESEYLCTEVQKRNSIMKPYTTEDLLESAEEGRQQIAQGNYVTSEELFSDLFEEYGIDPNDMKAIEDQLEEHHHSQTI